MKYILPYHLGSGNRGCEGICRGVSKIMNCNSNAFILHDRGYGNWIIDKKLGIDKIGVLRFRGNVLYESARFILRIIRKFGWRKPYLYLVAEHYLKDAKRNDYLLITGGDIYCYQTC